MVAPFLRPPAFPRPKSPPPSLPLEDPVLVPHHQSAKALPVIFFPEKPKLAFFFKVPPPGARMTGRSHRPQFFPSSRSPEAPSLSLHMARASPSLEEYTTEDWEISPLKSAVFLPPSYPFLFSHAPQLFLYVRPPPPDLPPSSRMGQPSGKGGNGKGGKERYWAQKLVAWAFSPPKEKKNWTANLLYRKGALFRREQSMLRYKFADSYWVLQIKSCLSTYGITGKHRFFSRPPQINVSEGRTYMLISLLPRGTTTFYPGGCCQEEKYHVMFPSRPPPHGRVHNQGRATAPRCCRRCRRGRRRPTRRSSRPRRRPRCSWRRSEPAKK